MQYGWCTTLALLWLHYWSDTLDTLGVLKAFVKIWKRRSVISTIGTTLRSMKSVHHRNITKSQLHQTTLAWQMKLGMLLTQAE
jgi:hypothetical protein